MTTPNNVSHNLSDVQPASARDDVRMTLPDGAIVAGPVDSTLEDLLRGAERDSLIHFEAPLIAAVCDGKLRELAYRIRRDVTVKPVTLAESDGGRIYRRSLVLLMVTAANELWPDVHISVNHAIRDGGFYCEFNNRAPFTADELQQLDQRMREIVESDAPIEKRHVELDEARQIFRERGDEDKLRLLDYREKNGLTLYSLRGHDDYYFGYMVPSSGYLSLFKLLRFDDAFVLQYPRKRNPHQLREARLYPKLSAVFAQSDEWLEKLAIEDIGRLNYLVKSDDIREMILVAEALHEQNVASIATEVSRRHADGTRIVLIAGPTSSGKTTFSKRLSIQLLAHGLRPFTMEMDNYFVNREDTPLDENGNYDFESLNALERDLLNEHLLRLMQGEEVQLRSYNFHTGKGEAGRLTRLNDRQIIILEGIHGLNPDLVPDVPEASIYRIYVSAMTQLNIDRHNRVPTTDVRLLRRIVRDARTRGYDATDTLERWNSVRRGEKRNIFPYQENADVMFNSALVYELAALRPVAEPLLLQVPYGIEAHLEANRLLSFLRWVKPLYPSQAAMIPDTSLLREFTGGLILDDYHPGEKTTSR